MFYLNPKKKAKKKCSKESMIFPFSRPLSLLQGRHKTIDGFLCDMLHHHNVREVAAKTRVIAVGQIEAGDDAVVRAREKHRVAIVRLQSELDSVAEFGRLSRHCRRHRSLGVG